MSTAELERFRLLASYVAGRAVDVAQAPAGERAHATGSAVHVSADGTAAEQRREMLLQAALLGAGSLDGHLVRSLRARPAVARRYLALEGSRVLAGLGGLLAAESVPGPHDPPRTATAAESLALATGRDPVPDPPDWFGVIKPSRLLTRQPGAGGKATAKELRLEFDLIDLPEGEEDDEDGGDQVGGSKILKLFENPLFNSRALSDRLRKLFGNSRSAGDGPAGAEMQVRAVRKVQRVGANAQPLPTRIHFTDDGKPGAALGIGGALHPEWDVHAGRYKPDWCRVLDFPLTVDADITAAHVADDDVLRRRLSRIGLGPKVLRRRPEGDDLDLEALIDLVADLRSGHSPAEHIHLERRRLERNLGVLILLDASGSATDTDPGGLAVHDHQRRAAATMAHTLEELGDRVAVYAFRSQGRHAVHLPAVKTFDQRFGAAGRARLNQLQPANYTRLGAGIRGAGDILKREAGTQNRLLVVLSDGHPYDEGYEGRYAEADAHKALEELRADGVACLCLTIGATTPGDALARVFGSAGHAGATTLGELSPRMDELFLSALRELAVAR